MGIPAVAPAQVPYDIWNWDANGKLVVAADLRGTLWNTISEFDWQMADMFNHVNGVLGTSGLQISNANSGMKVNISVGRARAMSALKIVQLVTPGVVGQPAAFNTTLVDGTSIPALQSRIDVIALQYDWATYTDGNSENHTVDETSIQIIVGTAGLNPVAPSLPDQSYVQLGTVTVPSGATTIAQCTIDNTKRTSYQDIGTLGAAVPTGVILEYDGTTAPNSYFYMLGPTGGPFGDGTYDPTVDTALAAVVGNRHGTSGGRYLLPDKTGRSGVGPDSTGAIIGSVLALGNTVGTATKTLITANMPSHTHIDNGHVHGTTETAHTHTQVAHTHIQNPHVHDITMLTSNAGTGAGPQYPPSAGAGAGVVVPNGTLDVVKSVTPTSQTTVAVNNTASTGLLVNSGVANNQNTGSGTAFGVIQPVMCFNYIIRR